MASFLGSNITSLTPYPSSTATQPIKRTYIPVRCGPRDNRGPLVKGRVLSIEAIQAVQALKRAHNDQILAKTLTRLVKSDLIATFNELLRQDRCDLALKVFSAVRSEFWYKTDLSLYADLVSALARKGMRDDIDRLICDLEGEGVIRCEDKGIVRLIRALIAAERKESTVRIYELMKRSGWGSTCVVDEYVAKVLSKGLKRLGEGRVAANIDREFGRLYEGTFGTSKV